MNIPLSPCVPENLVSRDGFSRPVPRQPAHLHTQAESVENDDHTVVVVVHILLHSSNSKAKKEIAVQKKHFFVTFSVSVR